MDAIFLTAVDVEAGLARFARIEGTTGEGLRGAGFDATLAIAALVREGMAYFQRSAGQDGDPAHAGPYLGGDQQTARTDPAQTCQPRRQLVGKEALKILVVHSVRSGDEEGLKALPIQSDAQAQGDAVQESIDSVVEVIIGPGLTV
jgi:hypothetical protein